MKAGGHLKVKNIGRLAFNSLRVEKGFKFSGHELTLDTTPYEALVDDEIDTEKVRLVPCPCVNSALNLFNIV